jgi:hypothetical protein
MKAYLYLFSSNVAYDARSTDCEVKISCQMIKVFPPSIITSSHVAAFHHTVVNASSPHMGAEHDTIYHIA